MITQIISNINYFLNLTISSEILWIIFPLAITTIVTLIYFERYFEEAPGWNTYVANSLALLFVAAYLLRHLFQLNQAGIVNFVLFPAKFIVSSLTAIIGIFVLLLNFKHVLPEKIAREISSPLTVNLVGYILILFVYSEKKVTIEIIFSLLIIFGILFGLLTLLKTLLKKTFKYLAYLKQKELTENLEKAKKEIHQKKKILKTEEKKIKNEEIKKIKKQKKELKKIQKIVKKI